MATSVHTRIADHGHRPVDGQTASSEGAHDLALLSGPRVSELLGAAVGAVGGEIVSWRARQLRAQRGGGASASYHTRVRWADGRVSKETMGACTGPPPEGTLVLDDGVERVAVWRFPFDPDLPGLRAAYDEPTVARLLRDVGVGDGPVRLRVRVYRPRRRAVIEAVGSHGRLFIKVVRPDRVEALHDRHRLMVAAGVPAPQSLGWTSDGVLVLQAVPGRPLRETLMRRSTPVPTGADIVSLLDRLPSVLTEGRHRPSWIDRVGHYAGVVALTLPDQASFAIDLAAAIASEAGTGDTVPVHGDFYETQIHVRDGRICGLLDLDTAGPGDRLDDLGCLLGHLSVYAQMQPQRAAALNRHGARYLAVFDKVVDPADIRYRIAAVVVSLATGPHRVQEPGWPAATARRLELARRWLDSARAARGRGR
jgi:aminoglycoside phosphotransferase